MANEALISDLGAAVSLALADLIEVEQGASPDNESKKGTLQQLVDLVADNISVPFSQTIALSDLSTALTSGSSEVGGWLADFSGSISSVLAALIIANSTSGPVTVDCKKNGVSIFSAKPSIDANESSSLTGTAGTLITTPITFVAGDIFLFYIDAAGTGAKGLQFTLKGTR